MNLRQARKLQPGDQVRAVVTVPDGADAHGRPGYIPGDGYQHDDIPAGQVLTFQRLIPKVRVVSIHPWQDKCDEMMLCEMQPGQRAWLNLGNAERV